MSSSDSKLLPRGWRTCNRDDDGHEWRALVTWSVQHLKFKDECRQAPFRLSSSWSWNQTHLNEHHIVAIATLVIAARAVIGITPGAVEATAVTTNTTSTTYTNTTIGQCVHCTARRIDLCVVPGDACGWHIRWCARHGHIELPRLALELLLLLLLLLPSLIKLWRGKKEKRKAKHNQIRKIIKRNGKKCLIKLHNLKGG